MKKINYLIFVFTLISLFFALIPNIKTTSYATNTSAKAMCVLEKDSKRILYSHNEHQKLPMASTTKVVTAITVLNNCDNLEEMIKVDDSAVGVEGTSIYLKKGETIKVKDLLYGLMLRSGNDSAVALACHVGGSVEGFASLMNELAVSVGARNSHFVNPHGLDHKDHYTTAYDLALISAYALDNPTFKEIVSTKNYVIDKTNKEEKRYLTNKNRLLSSEKGCCGVKTGFTSKAGRCLVSAIERELMTTVCVVLNCGPMFEESANLLNRSFEEYQLIKLIDKNKEIYNEYMIDDNNGKLYLYTDQDFSYPLKESEKENIKLTYNVKLNDAKENQEVGEIQVFYNNHLIKKLKLYTMNKIDKLIDSKTLLINELLWEENLNENK